MLPLAHYLQHVDDPEVNPNPYFDKAWYLRQYPEIARNGLDPVLHYWIFGVQERRDPGPWFSTDWYLWRYADVASGHESARALPAHWRRPGPGGRPLFRQRLVPASVPGRGPVGHAAAAALPAAGAAGGHGAL